jgi:hypothetical protein
MNSRSLFPIGKLVPDLLREDQVLTRRAGNAITLTHGLPVFSIV